ncbi:MAG: hypothetical protein [Caudoviricetes sp.]|nr:MAG: hypothetical protein [Caudoviricetes sp.]
MAQFRKLLVKNLVVGTTYVAFSARNRMLSRNGDSGVFVKVVSISGANIKVQVLGTSTETSINSLDTRKDAWMYDPAGSDMNVVARIADKAAWPGFSPRMAREGWDNKAFVFKEDGLYEVTEEDNADKAGTLLLRHEGDTIDPEEDMPYINTFLMSDIYPAEPPEWRIPRAQRMGIGAIELPLPPKPVAEQHKAIIDALSPHVVELRKKHTSENVSFAKYDADFDLVNEYRNQVCHARLQRTDDKRVKYILTIGRNDLQGKSSWVKGYASDEATRLYVTYLVSYSPYKNVFITKDVDFILEHGYIIDARQPARLVVAGCYATRQIWEKSERCEGFLSLYKAGIPLDLAFVFGCQCSEYKEGKMKFAQQGSDHSHLANGQLSNKCILNFLDGKPQFAGKPYNVDESASDNKHGGSYGVNGMWSSDFAVKTSPMFEKLKDIKQPGGWGKALPVEDAVERAADLIDDWIKEVGA